MASSWSLELQDTCPLNSEKAIHHWAQGHGLWLSPYQTLSTPWLDLQILFMNITKKNRGKGTPCKSPTSIKNTLNSLPKEFDYTKTGWLVIMPPHVPKVHKTQRFGSDPMNPTASFCHLHTTFFNQDIPTASRAVSISREILFTPDTLSQVSDLCWRDE